MAHIQGTNWRKDLNEFLLNYRATPHTTTKVSPAELFLGRSIKTRLPQCYYHINTKVDEIARHNDAKGKEYMKMYADKTRNAKQNQFKVGDKVRVLQRVTSKFMSKFEAAPCIITSINHSMITAKRVDGSEITRNSSHFTKVIDNNIDNQVNTNSNTNQTQVPRLSERLKIPTNRLSIKNHNSKAYLLFQQ